MTNFNVEQRIKFRSFLKKELDPTIGTSFFSQVRDMISNCRLVSEDGYLYSSIGLDRILKQIESVADAAEKAGFENAADLGKILIFEDLNKFLVDHNKTSDAEFVGFFINFLNIAKLNYDFIVSNPEILVNEQVHELLQKSLQIQEINDENSQRTEMMTDHHSDIALSLKYFSYSNRKMLDEAGEIETLKIYANQQIWENRGMVSSYGVKIILDKHQNSKEKFALLIGSLNQIAAETSNYGLIAKLVENFKKPLMDAITEYPNYFANEDIRGFYSKKDAEIARQITIGNQTDTSENLSQSVLQMTKMPNMVLNIEEVRGKLKKIVQNFIEEDKKKSFENEFTKELKNFQIGSLRKVTKNDVPENPANSHLERVRQSLRPVTPKEPFVSPQEAESFVAKRSWLDVAKAGMAKEAAGLSK